MPICHPLPASIRSSRFVFLLVDTLLIKTRFFLLARKQNTIKDIILEDTLKPKNNNNNIQYLSKFSKLNVTAFDVFHTIWAIIFEHFHNIFFASVTKFVPCQFYWVHWWEIVWSVYLVQFHSVLWLHDWGKHCRFCKNAFVVVEESCW